MTTSQRIVLVCLLAGGLTAVPLPLRADDKVETAERAQAVLRRYCQACHSGPADHVQADLQILDHNLLVKRKLVHPKDAAGSLLFQLVDYGSMPPGDLPKPQPAEVQTLHDWIADGAADFPTNHGEAYVMRKIQNDLATLNAKELPYQRYISFNHLLALADDSGADATLWRDALLKALNHLSWKAEPVPVTPIDASGSIFRVDERRLGWDSKPFETPSKTASLVDMFDLVLLEYPSAAVLPRFDGQQQILADYMRRANPVRPILYVRGDWFVTMATQSPLYEDLLRLPRTLAGLEAKITAGDKEARAAFLDAKSSRLPQLVEHRPAANGAYWRTFDMGPLKDLKSLLHEAASDGERGGLMLFSLPNGLNGYYIAENVPDEKDKRLVRQAPTAPTAWVADLQAADQVARNGLSCIRCHESGMATFADASRPALDDLSPGDKGKLAPLFPGKEAMDKLLADDQARFQAAVKAVHGGPLEREPLGPVTRRFLKSPEARHALPALTAEGPESVATATVAAGGDATLRNLVQFAAAADLDAPPVPPLDGLILADYQPPLSPVDVTIKALDFTTGKEAGVFLPGDQLIIEVVNQGKKEVYFELIGAFMDGRMNINQRLLKLAAGATYRYPQDRTNPPGGVVKKSVLMGLPPGVDRYILFAADREFPEGVRLRSPTDKDIGDRVVHPFWEISADGKEAVIAFDPTHLVKQTLKVETRER